MGGAAHDVAHTMEMVFSRFFFLCVLFCVCSSEKLSIGKKIGEGICLILTPGLIVCLVGERERERVRQSGGEGGEGDIDRPGF